ncbi:MAG: type II secretion system protein GspN [Myxococcota bacterium]
MGGWRSRPLLLALGIAALFVGFVVARFPYERLLPAAETAATNALGARVEIGSLGLGLGWGGPEAVAEALQLRWPGDDALQIERVGVRPAWALAWLEGRPRWHVAAAGPPGRFAGQVAPDRVDGAFDAVDVAALPWAAFGGSPPLRGRLSGVADLTLEDGAWQGFADMTSENGSIDYAGLPVAIPYAHLAARIELGPSQLTLPAARLEGPLITARFSGAATPGPGEPADWPLDLLVEVEGVDPALRSYLVPLGIRLDREGQASLRVSGTLAAPIVSASGG